MKKTVLKRITSIMLIINTVSIAVWSTNINEILNIVCIFSWCISDLWIIAFIYANCIYETPKKSNKKNGNKQPSKVLKIIKILFDLVLLIFSMANIAIGVYNIYHGNMIFILCVFIGIVFLSGLIGEYGKDEVKHLTK